ncbi:MAG: hypothetical protein WBO46_24720 [Caldilineaceae bacterium]
MNSPNSVHTAVLLLAGNHPRHNDEVENLSYGLVEVNGRTLVQCTVEQLVKSGFKKILIVTGQRSKALQIVSENPAVEVMYDALFADFGSMYALRRAVSKIQFPFLLIESNILFETRLIQLAQTMAQPNGVLVSTSKQPATSILAEGINNRLLAFAPRGEESNAQQTPSLVSLGIFKISRSMFAHMLAYAVERAYTDPFLDHIDCISGIAHTVDIRMVGEKDMRWTQVGSSGDMTKALNYFYPLFIQQEEQLR